MDQLATEPEPCVHQQLTAVGPSLSLVALSTRAMEELWNDPFQEMVGNSSVIYYYYFFLLPPGN